MKVAPQDRKSTHTYVNTSVADVSLVDICAGSLRFNKKSRWSRIFHNQPIVVDVKKLNDVSDAI